MKVVSYKETKQQVALERELVAGDVARLNNLKYTVISRDAGLRATGATESPHILAYVVGQTGTVGHIYRWNISLFDFRNQAGDPITKVKPGTEVLIGNACIFLIDKAQRFGIRIKKPKVMFDDDMFKGKIAIVDFETGNVWDRCQSDVTRLEELVLKNDTVFNIKRNDCYMGVSEFEIPSRFVDEATGKLKQETPATCDAHGFMSLDPSVITWIKIHDSDIPKQNSVYLNIETGELDSSWERIDYDTINNIVIN
jgi:hypothetical protein